jgi:hypothetical protein
MTSSSRPDIRIFGSLRSADGTGVVRIEDDYDTDIDDLWSALTDPDRLVRWLGQVDGDLAWAGRSGWTSGPMATVTGASRRASRPSGCWSSSGKPQSHGKRVRARRLLTLSSRPG